MPKKRPSRIALRRRSRAERAAPAANDYARDVLRELERAGAPLDADELARRLRLPRQERRAFDAGLAALELIDSRLYSLEFIQRGPARAAALHFR